MREDYWFDIHGKMEPNHEAMLSKLLDEDILFCNSRKYVDNDGTIQDETIVLFVNCGDTFAYACADAESITYNELPELFKLYEKFGGGGSTKWVCLKRNKKPLHQIIEKMKKDGRWDEKMEKLKENYCESRLKVNKK